MVSDRLGGDRLTRRREVFSVIFVRPAFGRVLQMF